MIGAVEIPLVAEHAFELAAIFCGALSGGLAAVRKNFDLFAVLLLAWATGLGGGILRDVLLGAVPPVGVSDWRFVAATVLAGLTIYFFHPRLARMRRAIIVLDAGALAFFVVVGAQKGLELGAGPVAAVFVGMLTGIGGGLVRDLLVDEAPIVLRERELYAIPALLGAGATVVAGHFDVLGDLMGILIVAAVFALRLTALRLHWLAPGPWRGMRRGDPGA